MKRLNNIHPGEILQEEFLIPLNISAYKLAKDIHIPQTRISQIIKKQRSITADTAIRLSIYFGVSAKFWLGLQDDYDIEELQAEKMKDFKSVQKLVIENV
ncbi:MAG TPA: HigA family addiction module antitoxin [Chitinophagales bacterium]|jgi:addiction module HigA family antidote|nr:HigA family addiction module antitoxin [Chitinophagales bacterium]HPH88329.1 HigA family addiction module antitoxin [Chitinophagales bacterium]HPN18793.1 HigA family addiction module antitoxin [Chitinophagales bacterium]